MTRKLAKMYPFLCPEKLGQVKFPLILVFGNSDQAHQYSTNLLSTKRPMVIPVNDISFPERKWSRGSI